MGSKAHWNFKLPHLIKNNNNNENQIRIDLMTDTMMKGYARQLPQMH